MRPILFNTEMVKAILDGRKTQFRIAIDFCKIDDIYINENGKNVISIDDSVIKTITEEYLHSFINKNSKFKVDDILYVKETFGETLCGRIRFKADGGGVEDEKAGHWKPSIYLKQKDARIFLKVTNVRVERLQDMSYDDCLKEGFLSMQLNPDCSFPTVLKDKKITNTSNVMEDWFKKQWNSTTKDGYKWEDNPYVFVYEFERIENKDLERLR
jgi:hypothetical protein